MLNIFKSKREKQRIKSQKMSLQILKNEEEARFRERMDELGIELPKYNPKNRKLIEWEFYVDWKKIFNPVTGEFDPEIDLSYFKQKYGGWDCWYVGWDMRLRGPGNKVDGFSLVQLHTGEETGQLNG